MKGAIIPNENLNNTNKIANSNISNINKKVKHNSSVIVGKNETYSESTNINIHTSDNTKSHNNLKQVTSPLKINLKKEPDNNYSISNNLNLNKNKNNNSNADNLANAQSIINEKQEYINFLLNENEALKKKLKEKNVENKSLNTKLGLLNLDNRQLTTENLSYQGRVSQSVLKNSLTNMRGNNENNLNTTNFQTENNNTINKLNVKSTVVNHASPKEIKLSKEVREMNNLKDFKDKKIDQSECKYLKFKKKIFHF